MKQSPNDKRNAIPPELAAALPGALGAAPRIAHARFRIGDTVRHRMFGFRGVVFDIDPVFANSEEWYEAIPVAARPPRDQPFYHLFADNGESSYVAYVSQQNLVADETGDPIDHPAIDALFERKADGGYALGASRWH
ncbi:MULTISPECIES: heat shock protein HspQ [Sphingobium]|uniref:Heat shock protein HspQ n=1 Tax=Sphingobium lignivorans TaxID=2735886 RepID=A0ABR6NEC9_9SPHN|nr:MULTISPECIES: heat shock protein HspQ [Sphingobium]MBB5985633.1 heat shock protein HspQ [Sphingobium lignivorans]BAK66254.1 putative DNA-binding protein [Sphingobium sp. SYK-6]